MLVISCKIYPVKTGNEFSPKTHAYKNGKHMQQVEKKTKLNKKIQIFKNENLDCSKWDEFDDLFVSLHLINNEIDKNENQEEDWDKTATHLNLGMLG